MSIKIVQQVFERSRSVGTARVIMLALADHADQYGIAWPSAARLAGYANINRRNVLHHIAALVKLGEIVAVGCGMRGVKRYRIILPTGVDIDTGDGIDTSDGIDIGTGDGSDIGTGDEIDTQTINEPSIEPSIDSQSTELLLPGESQEKAVIRLWNEIAERLGLSTVQKLTSARKKSIPRRLKDCGGLEGWKLALEKVGKNTWMHGRNDRGWKVDFDFLMKEGNFTKLMEGGYENSENESKKGRGGNADALNDAFDEMEAEIANGRVAS